MDTALRCGEIYADALAPIPEQAGGYLKASTKSRHVRMVDQIRLRIFPNWHTKAQIKGPTLSQRTREGWGTRCGVLFSTRLLRRRGLLLSWRWRRHHRVSIRARSYIRNLRHVAYFALHCVIHDNARVLEQEAG